jgi:hypothetical protein
MYLIQCPDNIFIKALEEANNNKLVEEDFIQMCKEVAKYNE